MLSSLGKHRKQHGGTNKYEGTTSSTDNTEVTYAYSSNIARQGSYYLGITVHAEDYAGNILEKDYVYGPYKIDKVGPTTTITATKKDANGSSYTGEEWSKEDVLVKISATDGGSGVSSYQYSTDGSSWNSGSEYTVTTEGTSTIYARATDRLRKCWK